MNNIRLESGWDVYAFDKNTINEHIIKIAEELTPLCDYEIGFAIVGGNGSLVVLLLDEAQDGITEKVKEHIRKMLSYPPDFSTRFLTNEDSGCMIMMDQGCWHLIPSGEVKLDKGDISFAQAYIARATLIEDCKEGRILGYIIPPGCTIVSQQFSIQ